MTIPTASAFPTALDSDTTLFGDPADRILLTLTTTITSASTSFVVDESIALITVPTFLAFATGEIVYCAAKNDAAKTFSSLTRASPASHDAGETIRLVLVSDYIKQIKKALIAIETAIGITSSPHFVKTNLVTAANDFLVGTNNGIVGKKTLAETLTILGKDVASGIPSLDENSLVTQDPAHATATPTADAIVVADENGFVNSWVAAAGNEWPGIVELATVAETTAGADDTRTVTPNGLAGSTFGQRIVQIKVFDDGTYLDDGGLFTFCVPAALNGYKLVDAAAYVTMPSSDGLPTIGLWNLSGNHDMLSTPITIDENGYSSYFATYPMVIDTNHDTVYTSEQIQIYIDTGYEGTSAMGLGVILTFQLVQE